MLGTVVNAEISWLKLVLSEYYALIVVIFSIIYNIFFILLCLLKAKLLYLCFILELYPLESKQQYSVVPKFLDDTFFAKSNFVKKLLNPLLKQEKLLK